LLDFCVLFGGFLLLAWSSLFVLVQAIAWEDSSLQPIMCQVEREILLCLTPACSLVH